MYQSEPDIAVACKECSWEGDQDDLIYTDERTPTCPKCESTNLEYNVEDGFSRAHVPWWCTCGGCQIYDS